MHKIPRLSSKYESIFRGGDSEETAIKNAEFAFRTKIFSVLDKFVVVRQPQNGYKFEAEIHYLKSKYADELTNTEKLRLKGVKSKIILAESIEKLLVQRVDALSEVGFYEVLPCRNVSRLEQTVEDFVPDLLILSDKIGGVSGDVALKLLRKVGHYERAIVYGDLRKDEVLDKYFGISNLSFFLFVPHDSQLVEYAEKALNDVAAIGFDGFYVP